MSINTSTDFNGVTVTAKGGNASQRRFNGISLVIPGTSNRFKLVVATGLSGTYNKQGNVVLNTLTPGYQKLAHNRVIDLDSVQALLTLHIRSIQNKTINADER